MKKYLLMASVLVLFANCSQTEEMNEVSADHNAGITNPTKPDTENNGSVEKPSVKPDTENNGDVEKPTVQRSLEEEVADIWGHTYVNENDAADIYEMTIGQQIISKKYDITNILVNIDKRANYYEYQYSNNNNLSGSTLLAIHGVAPDELTFNGHIFLKRQK